MRLKSALLAALVSVGALAQTPSEPDYDAAAAVLFGTTLNRTLTEMEQSGLQLNRERFAELLAKVLTGAHDVDSALVEFTPESAEALLLGAMTPQRPPAVPPMDAAEENAWVKAQLKLPRTEELDGGVVLQRLVEGSGEQPGPTSRVKVMYTGQLSSGQVFDQTEEAFLLPVDGVISGLSRALQHMRVGGTYRVFIPPAEAYGSEAIMDLIPGNSALDFTITIEEIEQK